jgi:GTP-binding protein HflX
LSAVEQQGLLLLLSVLSESLGKDLVSGRLILAPHQGRLRAAIYQQNAVVSEYYDEQGQSVLEIKIPRHNFCQLIKAADLEPEQMLAEMTIIN